MGVTTGKEASLNLIDVTPEGDLVLSLEASTEPLSVSVDQRLSFKVPAARASAFRASGLPRHATFDPVEGRFSWRPRPGQEGVWVITLAPAETETLTPLAVRISVHASPAKIVDLR
jgi:hypothetical protein